MLSINELSPGKKIFFVSDFHLGVPDEKTSLERERKIVRWLESIQAEAEAIFILGDIFDFWYEYKYTIPKGFIRFQGKLAEMRDKGIPIYFFTGNHDMWMFGYFSKELDIPIYRQSIELQVGNTAFLIGHGDGLGPGDYGYKILKKVFSNRLCEIMFGVLPSRIGMGIGHKWSRGSRKKSNKDKIFLGEKEHLWIYCKETERVKHHDYYIFGHRHLPLDLPVAENSRYINLGEWFSHCNFGVFDGAHFKVLNFNQ